MLTVLIPTRDRAENLPRVLDAYRQLDPVPGGWRLVVVDNASIDATAEVLERYRRLLPLEVRREEKSGKNRALNSALEAVAGDLVVFSDDDSLPAPDWLRKLRAVADARPEADLFGGRIVPEWTCSPPAWIERYGVNTGVAYALTKQREGPCPPDLVWGPNMAVRRRVFETGLRFNPTIGPGSENAYGMGGETEFNQRAGRAGFRAYFCDRAVVRHLIRPEQTSERWLLRRAFHHGLGVARYHPDQAELSSRTRIMGLPLGLCLRLACYSAAGFLLWPLPCSRRRFRVLYRCSWLWGLATQQRRANRDRETKARRRTTACDDEGPSPHLSAKTCLNHED